jgi:hypothetical protein
MKKLAIALLVLILLAVTNPSREDYTAWLQEKIEAKTENPVMKGLVTLFGESFIENATTTQDFIIFTIYHVSFDGKKIKILGILKNFIPFYSAEE